MRFFRVQHRPFAPAMPLDGLALLFTVKMPRVLPQANTDDDCFLIQRGDERPILARKIAACVFGRDANARDIRAAIETVKHYYCNNVVMHIMRVAV